MYQVSDTRSSVLLAEKRKSDDSNANAEASQPVSNRAQHLAGSTSKKSQRRTPCHEGTMLDASSPIRKLGATPSQAILRHGAGSGRRKSRSPTPSRRRTAFETGLVPDQFFFHRAESAGPDPERLATPRPLPTVLGPRPIRSLRRREVTIPSAEAPVGFQDRVEPRSIPSPGWSCLISSPASNTQGYQPRDAFREVSC